MIRNYLIVGAILGALGLAGGADRASATTTIAPGESIHVYADDCPGGLIEPTDGYVKGKRIRSTYGEPGERFYVFGRHVTVGDYGDPAHVRVVTNDSHRRVRVGEVCGG